MIGGRVLDVTALRDLTVGRTVYSVAFLAAANDLAIPLAIPAAALQEAWAGAAVENHPFVDLLLGLPLTVVESLDATAAQRSGVLAHDVHAGDRWDAGAAHAVLVAQDRDWAVLTADPVPLRAIDPAVPVELLPQN